MQSLTGATPLEIGFDILVVKLLRAYGECLGARSR
jgi:hypothetical protein